MLAVTLVVLQIAVAGSGAAEPELDGHTLYADACAGCHGDDGRGKAGTGVTVTLPDFTDCKVATAEPDSNWLPLIAHGGAELGLSNEMPAFADALSPEQQRAVLEYVRSFCRDPAWPSGDLNFPRAVFVGKAFPEDEVLVAPFFNASSEVRETSADLSYEGRVGARGQIELALPLQLNDFAHGGPTTGGFGDLTLAYQQVVFASLASRSILSLATDLVLPSGDPKKGTGDGTVSFEPALLGGWAVAGLILQTELRAVLPLDTDRAPRQLLYRFALQYPLGAMRRSLVPALEFESAQKLAGSFRDTTALGPTFYVPLSKRGHVGLGFGGQVAVTASAPFDYRLGGFVFWDFLDGPLW